MSAFLWLTIGFLAGATVTPWSKLFPADRARVLQENEVLPLEERLLKVSERFLGTPYIRSPLGEGTGVDPDPPFRLDAADCVTLVEETIAMALAKRAPEVEEQLVELRYDGTPSYGNRNHLMEAQWLPNNIRKGFLEDVTGRYAHGAEKRVSKRITRATWNTRSGKGLGLASEFQKLGTFGLPLISLEDFAKVVKEVPSGTVVVVIREDLPYLITRVSHLGFLVKKDGGSFIRHAASVRKAVVDEPVDRFLRRNAAQQTWKVEGVALYRVLDRPRP
jgi:hypothetical protein